MPIRSSSLSINSRRLRHWCHRSIFKLLKKNSLFAFEIVYGVLIFIVFYQQIFEYLRNTLLATLEAHQSWVRDLQFCHNSPFFQLVSLGDRIVWWNVNSARLGTISHNSHNPTHSKGSSHLAGGMGFPLTPITPGSSSSTSSSRFASASVTQSSQLNGLVQTVEFQTKGRYASKLFVSDDGRSLVTVSDSGILYILHQLSHH